MSITVLASLHCLFYTTVAWIAAYAAWQVHHGAAVLMALIGFLALVLAVVPFIWQP
jgi:hypothetical protein